MYDYKTGNVTDQWITPFHMIELQKRRVITQFYDLCLHDPEYAFLHNTPSLKICFPLSGTLTGFLGN